VLGLLSNASKTSVTGVRVRHYNYPQQNPSATEEALQANSGGCQWAEFAAWLEALGYAPPQETVINSFLGYASRWYRRPTGLRSEWQTLVVWLNRQTALVLVCSIRLRAIAGF